jgi:hypothetical protein
MRPNVLRFIRRSAEFLEQDDIYKLKRNLRGIYVLYRKQPTPKGRRLIFDVRYIGMSTSGIGGRLRSHKRSKRKTGEWTHFSIFEVWDNVTNEEVAELEGLARHLYRFDQTASTLNIQRGYKRLRHVRDDKVGNWK